MDAIEPMDAIEVIRSESDRFARVLLAADPDARVPTCPEWNAADLAWHLATVHRFWASVLAEDVRDDERAGALEEAAPPQPATMAEIAAAGRDATDALLEQLEILPDDAPRWTWWPPEQTVGFTRRMQLCEATMHRVDAELAAGVEVSPLAPGVAAAALDHGVEVMWGWRPPWADYAPTGILRVAATDTGRSRLVEVGYWSGTSPRTGDTWHEPRTSLAPDASEATAQLVGTQEDLALWVWTRGGSVELDGDPATVAAITRLHEQGIP